MWHYLLFMMHLNAKGLCQDLINDLTDVFAAKTEYTTLEDHVDKLRQAEDISWVPVQQALCLLGTSDAVGHSHSTTRSPHLFQSTAWREEMSEQLQALSDRVGVALSNLDGAPLGVAPSPPPSMPGSDEEFA